MVWQAEARYYPFDNVVEEFDSWETTTPVNFPDLRMPFNSGERVVAFLVPLSQGPPRLFFVITIIRSTVLSVPVTVHRTARCESVSTIHQEPQCDVGIGDSVEASMDGTASTQRLMTRSSCCSCSCRHLCVYVCASVCLFVCLCVCVCVR